MFCVLCNHQKAENGCYLPGKFTRVCLSCYQELVGSLPLPANAPSAFGGKFADADKLVSAFKSEGQKKLGAVMNDLSKSTASFTGGVFANMPSSITNEVNEGKKLVQEKVSGGIETFKDRITDGTSNLQDILGDKATDVEQKLRGKANRVLRKADKLLGKFL